MKKFIWITLVIIISLVAWSNRESRFLNGHDHSVKSQDLYYCPMHPTFTSPKPGVCPICSMDLVKRENPKSDQHSKNPQMLSTSSVPGYASLSLDQAKQQLIGVRTFKVAPKVLQKSIRAVGRVVHNLELYEAKLEYIAAWQNFRLLRARSLIKDDFREVQVRFLKAEYALQHMGINEDELKELRELQFGRTTTDRPGNYKEIFRKPLNNQELFVFHNEDATFIYAEVFESDLPSIRIGQSVQLEIPDSGKKIEGTVKGISTEIQPETRTARVRIVLPDHDPNLKADMFIKVQFLSPMEKGLLIPSDAVLRTGERTIVFVQKHEGHFEPKAIEIGEESQGFIQVRSGLIEGELVVTGANFLLDSESRLQSALQDFSGGAGGHNHE